MNTATIGFSPDEIDLSLSTRAVRLKWVIAVDAELPAGRAANAAVCLAAPTTDAVTGLLGPDVRDADGRAHPGLPWTGCTILAATRDQLATIARKAASSADVFVADMPALGQATRVYDDYVREMSQTDTEHLDLLAVSIVGPRNRVDRLVGSLPLLP
jgi:hypothetical protein